MKNNMEDIDKLIKETLTEEEKKFYDGLDEQGLFGMIGSLFKGKNSWLALLLHVMNIVLFLLLIYCIIQTFDVKNTNDLILWVGAVLFCFIAMSVIKIHVWMQIHKNSIIRELKRLELQVSSLSGKLKE